MCPLCVFCGGELQIRVIDRVCEIPHEGPFCDLMWSDPEDIESWAVSPRGAGWLFGRNVTSEFNQINGAQGEGPAGEWRRGVSGQKSMELVVQSCPKFGGV